VLIARKNVIDSIEAADTPARCAVKTLIAAVYCSVSLLITSFVMVIVHDRWGFEEQIDSFLGLLIALFRVPDMKTYPPLPDIILDNIPLIPWAFHVCELLVCALGIFWLLVLVFHKHRCVEFCVNLNTYVYTFAKFSRFIFFLVIEIFAIYISLLIWKV